MKKFLPLCFLAVFFLPPLFMHAQKPVFNHLALYVTDLQKSTNFYRDVIGLDTVPEPFHDGRHTWFAIGPTGRLHVIAGAATTAVHVKDNHLCFSVPSVNDFVKRLNKANIPYEDWPGKAQSITTRVDGVKQVYFKDPDGYWIEVNDAAQ
jgi:lactoylglutathione lyase